MPVSKIMVSIVVDPNCNLLSTPTVTLPSQSWPIEVVWAIRGATFTTNGIVLNTPFPPAIALPMGPPAPVGDGTWSLFMLNNDKGTSGSFQYTVNYNCNGQTFSADPTIENQPPPG